MLNGFQFDPLSHLYTMNGMAMPSVTQVLKGTGLVDYSMIPQPVLIEAAARGRAVHEAIRLAADDELDEGTVAPAHQPYLDAYQKFVRETHWQPALVEHRMWDAQRGYAGTLDQTGMFTQAKSLTLLDIKTGPVVPGHSLQLAAYAALMGEHRRYRRIILELRGNGIYKLVEFPPANFETDLRVFYSALSCVHWQLKCDPNFLAKLTTARAA